MIIVSFPYHFIPRAQDRQQVDNTDRAFLALQARHLLLMLLRRGPSGGLGVLRVVFGLNIHVVEIAAILILAETVLILRGHPLHLRCLAQACVLVSKLVGSRLAVFRAEPHFLDPGLLLALECR